MGTLPRTMRLIVAIATATVAGASLPSMAAAADPDQWAWAVVRNPSKSYELKPKDGASSGGGRVRVKRIARGSSRLTFKGLSVDERHVQVTPLSSAAAMCRWIGGGQQEGQEKVACYDRYGRAKDVPFVFNMVRSTAIHAGPRLAYVRANQGRKKEPYQGYPAFASTGTADTLTKLGEGHYHVRIPAIFTQGGNLQVTPFSFAEKTTCRIASWAVLGVDVRAETRCYDLKGKPRNSKYSLIYTSGEGLKGDGGGAWAYLLAHAKKSASYVPVDDYSAESSPGTPRVKRLKRGQYRVKLPSMPLGGSVQVTALDERKRCQASSIKKKDGPQKIGVRCFSANGKKRADSVFMLSYAK